MSTSAMRGNGDLTASAPTWRKTTVRVFLSSLAAIAAPGLSLMLLLFLPPTVSSDTGDIWIAAAFVMGVATLFSASHFIPLGIPYVLVLLKTGRLGWLWMVPGGFAIGFLLNKLPRLLEYRISKSVWEMATMLPEHLALSLLPGLFGGLGGVAFMIVFSALSAGAAAAARRDRRAKAVAATGHAVAVYFNSACPVCRTGIEWQQSQVSSCEIEWIDVHDAPDAVADIGAELEDVRERLHVRDAEGRVLVGADAVAFVMGNTPGQRWLGRLSTLPLIRPAMRWAYDAFARVLYRWNRRKRRW